MIPHDRKNLLNEIGSNKRLATPFETECLVDVNSDGAELNAPSSGRQTGESAMRLLVAGVVFAVCSATALAQSVTTFNYDARGRLNAVRSGIGVRSDYNLDAADNRSGYHAAQQFATAYAAINLPHIVGYADGGGWAVNAGTGGFMTYGPYTTSIPAGSHVATVRVMIDNNSADNGSMLNLDVNDYTTGQVLASVQITRQQWARPYAYQVFELPFSLSDSGHQIEIRTYSFGNAYMRVDKVGYY